MKLVYMFNEGDATMRNLLGGKGANLCQMTRLNLPVPQGFIVCTEACTQFHATNKLEDKVVQQIKKAIKKLENLTGKKLGDAQNPLLLSVRSGARVSMPGMMDSVLNLGLNDKIVKEFAKVTQNPKFAYDCYRRFIQMFANVVYKIDGDLFEKEIDALKKAEKIVRDQEFTPRNLQALIKSFKAIFKAKTGKPFPQDPQQMLFECIEGVFRSWDNERAQVYRKVNNIPDDWGTAVNVQEMVFGNLNEQSGTGVCFSRNPTNGENVFFGEFLLNAQGEDIVSGARTPSPIADLSTFSQSIYDELYAHAKHLENFYGDMQDMEFTIENGKLYVLQTRSAKRTHLASLRVAVDLVSENVIDKQTALDRIDASKTVEALGKNLQVPAHITPISSGIPASPGGAVGRIALSATAAKKFVDHGESSILVRIETSPDDITGMTICQGILTARGGTTSHAAVVARGMGTVCVSGCADLEIVGSSIKLGKHKLQEGDIISLDGTTGNIYLGALDTTSGLDNKYLQQLLAWAKENQQIQVFANADTPVDAKNAIKQGAKGVGLCRTEHMFFSEDRAIFMQKMILAKDQATRQSALKKLLTFQKQDFANMFTAMKGMPVTIRLLDPPLREFMPKSKQELSALAAELGITEKALLNDIDNLAETNPMMGNRGLRLAFTAPEIYQMQVRAIIESAQKVQNKLGMQIVPEIMLPLTCDEQEFVFVKNIVLQTIKTFDPQSTISIKLGTMIETPRAAFLASSLAQHCDFFSFGTNDLTQFMFGFSRDDASKFLNHYYKHGIFKQDIFMHLDKTGVGALMQQAVVLAKRINPNLKCGICGEHAADPTSIQFCKKIGLDYVSCSVARISVAQIASAQNS